MKIPKTKSKLIFVLSATGSAVGMANVWGFPYKFHKGGFFFLLFYLIFVFIFSFVGLSSEFAVGRMGSASVVRSYEKAIKTRFKRSKTAKYFGYLPMLISLIISVGYTIILSYVGKALFDTINGNLRNTDPGLWFQSFSSRSFSVIEIHFLIIFLTVVISLGGFKAFNNLSSILMPTMIVIYIIVMLKMLSLENIREGYLYLFRIDRANLNIGTVIAAMGDALFALSITGFGMVFLGKSLSENQDIIFDSKLTGIFDTVVALLSAFVIVPSLFVFSIEGVEGPALIFRTLPTIFNSLRRGSIFAILFYSAMLMAGLTSLQNVFQAMANVLIKDFDISYQKSIYLVGIIIFALGLGFHPLARWSVLMDLTLYYFVPLGATLGSIIWFYVMDPNVLIREINKGGKKKIDKRFIYIGRFIYTPLVIIVCLMSIMFH